MSLETLLRPDCPAYNEALREAFRVQPGLTNEPSKAAELAMSLYAEHAPDLGKVQSAGVRATALQHAARSAQLMPWLRVYEQEKVIRWGLTAIVDTVSLSEQEQSVLASTFESFDYHHDDDYQQSSFSAMTANRHTADAPSESYITAAKNIALDEIEAQLLAHPKTEGPTLPGRRPRWRQWFDKAVLNFS